MVKPAIAVDGVRELRRELRHLSDKAYDQELKELHKAIADEVTDRAARKTPVRTGKLRRSVRGSGTKAAAVGRVGSKSVPYAAAIHWGWPKHNIRPHPFLQDAARELERSVIDRYDSAIADLLDRVVSARRSP